MAPALHLEGPAYAEVATNKFVRAAGPDGRLTISVVVGRSFRNANQLPEIVGEHIHI
jgi:hypothetical protein